VDNNTGISYTGIKLLVVIEHFVDDHFLYRLTAAVRNSRLFTQVSYFPPNSPELIPIDFKIYDLHSSMNITSQKIEKIRQCLV